MAKGCQSQYKHVDFAEDCTCDGKSVGYGDLYAERTQAFTSAPYLGEN